MDQEKFQELHYEIGEFKENNWYCGYGALAKHRTSRKDVTKGEECKLAFLPMRMLINREDSPVMSQLIDIWRVWVFPLEEA